MEDWRTFLVEIFEELGGEGNLTKDIYPLVHSKGLKLPNTWKATLRNALELNSSDSEVWNGKNDIFELKNKGTGVWALKESSKAKKIEKPLLDFEQVVVSKKAKEHESLSLRQNNKIPRYKSTKEKLPAGIKFERGVWKLFFNMGAKIFNNDKELKFDLSSSNANQSSKQIDNFFIMRDGYVFIVECKESLQKGGKNASNLIRSELSNLKNLKKPIEKRFRKIFNNKPGFKIIHVLATSGYNWETSDIEKLTKAGFILLRDEEIEYFSGCYENSKSSWFTFNQFLATFRKNKPDFNPLAKAKELVAFRTRKDFYENENNKDKLSYVYTTSMKVKDLLRVSSVSHHSASSTYDIYNLGDNKKSAYQRILKASRLNRKTGIPPFIEATNKPFINNLLVNYKGDIPLNELFESREKLGEGRGGILKFNKMSPGMFHIIDGQHRLFGYSPLFEDDEECAYGEHELVVTLFDNMPPPEEAKLFLHINTKQEGINANLIIEIEQLSGADASPKKQIQNMSKTIVDHLKSDDKSPFHKPKAIKGYQKNTDVYGDIEIEGKLTPKGIMLHIQKSPLLSRAKDDFTTGLAFKDGKDVTDKYVNTINNLKDIYIDYFSKIKKSNPELWIKYTKDGKEVSNDQKMASNIPIGGLQILLDHFVNLKVKDKGKNINKLVEVYVNQLTKGLKNLKPQDENDLFNSRLYGGSAPKQFYFILLEKFFPNLISSELQKEIDKDRTEFKTKQIVYITDPDLVKENKTLKKQLNDKNYGTQSLAFRQLFANNIDPFFIRLFGENYWQDVFEQQSDKKIADATDKSRSEYRKRRNELKNNKDEIDKISKRPKILWIEWIQWKDLISFVFNKSEILKDDLSVQCINSDKFNDKYNGEIKEVIRDIFFISKNIKNNDTNVNLNWMSLIPKIRMLAAHGDEFLEITKEEEKEYLEIRNSIQEVVKKLADFSID